MTFAISKFRIKRVKESIFIVLILFLILGGIEPAYAQTISRSPTSGTVGTSVTITGSSFQANRPVVVRYDGLQVTNATTSSTGGFVVVFAVPSSTRGVHVISASDGISSATTTFTVTSSLSRSPTSGPVGTTITLTGYGFASSATLTITWDGTTLYTSPSPIQTDANGHFVATVLALNGEPISHTIVASDSSGSASTTFTTSRRLPSRRVQGK